MAFEASADERDTRGFISITMISFVSGFTANCTLEPPVSTPTARITVMAWSRSVWYWMSLRASAAGATVTLSPVCTPIGSTFSIEQMTTTLSALSRISSSSNSPQPMTDSSISTWLIGLAASPSATRSWYSASERAMPPPWPPIVKPGRTMAGRPMSSRAASASASEWAMRDRATRRPAASMVSLNSSRSSARWMAP